VHITAINGGTDMPVKDVQIDSRNVSRGSVFVAVRVVLLMDIILSAKPLDKVR
jgi:hypothetical protein